mmetsp:Transcript_29022/g.46002  ORF Transcript_29022/g.46002 Transcript_29022/m.46002 type:complete len:167 (-) Transcript_29022:194-694(-)
MWSFLALSCLLVLSLANENDAEGRKSRLLLSTSSLFGGSGGDPYTMLPKDASAYVKKVCIRTARSNSVIEQLTFYYTSGDSDGPYGNSSGDLQCYEVDGSNCFLTVSGNYGTYLNGIQFTQGNGNSSPYYGGSSGSSFSSSGSGCLKGAYIRSGTLIDRIQLVWHD